METLEYTVRKVYSALKDTEDYISRRYNYIEPLLPDDISFITSQELEDMFLETALQKDENCVLQKQKAPYSSHRSEKCSLQAKSTTDVRRTMTTGS